MSTDNQQEQSYKQWASIAKTHPYGDFLLRYITLINYCKDWYGITKDNKDLINKIIKNSVTESIFQLIRNPNITQKITTNIHSDLVDKIISGLTKKMMEKCPQKIKENPNIRAIVDSVITENQNNTCISNETIERLTSALTIAIQNNTTQDDIKIMLDRIINSANLSNAKEVKPNNITENLDLKDKIIHEATKKIIDALILPNNSITQLMNQVSIESQTTNPNSLKNLITNLMAANQTRDAMQNIINLFNRAIKAKESHTHTTSFLINANKTNDFLNNKMTIALHKSLSNVTEANDIITTLIDNLNTVNELSFRIKENIDVLNNTPQSTNLMNNDLIKKITNDLTIAHQTNAPIQDIINALDNANQKTDFINNDPIKTIIVELLQNIIAIFTLEQNKDSIVKIINDTVKDVKESYLITSIIQGKALKGIQDLKETHIPNFAASYRGNNAITMRLYHAYENIVDNMDLLKIDINLKNEQYKFPHIWKCTDCKSEIDLKERWSNHFNKLNNNQRYKNQAEIITEYFIWMIYFARCELIHGSLENPQSPNVQDLFHSLNEILQVLVDEITKSQN